MAQLTLHIIGNTDDIDKKLNLVKEKIKSLGEQSIKFSVDEKGVEAAVAQLKNFTAEQIKATEAAAKLANAEARKINAQTKAAESAAKLSKEAKKHAEATQQAAKETEHFALTNEQVKQKMLDTAKQTDYLRGKVSELYTQYLSITKESSGVASGQEQIATSMALVVRNAGTLQVQIRALTTAYNELRQASGIGGSGGGSSQYGGRFIGGETQPQLGSGINWTYGRGYDIEIDTTQVKGTANAVNDVADAMGKASSVTERMSQDWKQFVDNTRSADNASKGLLGTLGQYINWYLRWTLVSEAFQAMVSSIKNAIKTMKDVDQELTNIQKVSDLTAQEVAKIGDAAYDAASKFGVAATDYLSAVYTFQKAGLGESATQMAELATKTMLVGDTSADVASKFLIAVNAAWKLNGSITALNKVVDEADYINNNYATDLAKLSAGMPIVASTAANLNMSIEETLAVLGTITAATQETGTKAATAWRALAMNITGEIGTIVDETGETIEVTEESVKSIADALKIYGNDAVKAAQETGKLVDPMEAVISLAQAYKDGLLEDIELQNILMGVGGKLRTNQLTALVRDLASETSTYYDIMSHLGDAAGTADKEVATMLDSWNAKTQILTNTWTKFISHLIESKQIKSGIDALTTAVKFLDSGFGKFAVTAGLLATATTLLTKTFIRMPAQLATIALKATMGATAFAAMSAEELAAAVASMTLGEALKAIGVALINNPVAWIAAATVALYGLIKLVDKLDVTYEEHLEKLDELQSKYDELYGAAGELETLKERVGELTDKEIERLGVLEAQKQQLEEQIQKEKELTFQAWQRSQVGLNYVASPTGTLDVQYYDKTNQALDDATKAYHSLGSEMDAGQHTNEKYVAGLNKIINALKEDADAIKLGKEAGQTLTPTQEALLSLYESLTLEVGKYTQKTELETKAKQNNAGATDEVAEANEALKKAMEEVEKKSSLTYGTIAQLDKLYPGFSKKILDVNGNLAEEGKAALSSRNAFADLIAQMTIFNNSGLDVSQKIMALQQLAEQAGITGAAVNFAANNRGIATEIQAWMDSGLSYGEAQNKALSNYWGTISRQMQNTEYIPTKAGGGGGTVKTPQQTELDARKETVALLKAELNLMKERGDSTEKQVALMRQIQNALHDEAEKMREIEGESANVKALSAEWWKYENEIADIQEKIAKQLKEDIADVLGDIVDSLQASADAMTQPLQDELDALNAQRDAVNDRREEEEKILAVEKARIALENAQRERTVRQYNAATGQWEWVANAKNVEQAQKNLIDAENALQKYREEQAYNLQKENLEKQITSTNSAFDALKDAINEVTKAIKDGKMSYEDAYAYIKAKMKDIYDNYGLDLTSVLTDSVNGILDVDKLLLDVQNETNRLLLIAKMQANSAEWHSAGEDRQKELHDENVKIGTALGWTFNGDGTWLNEKGEVAYFVGANGATGGSYGDNDLIAEIRNLVAALAQGGTQAPAISMQTSIGSAAESAPATTAAAAQTSSPATAGTKSSGANVKDAYGSSIHLSGSDVDKINALAPGTPGIITLSDGTQVHKNADGTINVATGSGFWAENASLYDSGGILRGIGGIKATRRDEMVLNPDMTQKLLTAEMNGAFDKLMGHLGIVTAAANNLAGFGGGLPSNSIGTQNNGDSYNFGNITLSEREAKAMTVYDLAQMSRNLGLTS